MIHTSTIIDNAVNEISKLPGIGRRTALRLALYILKQPKNNIHNLTRSISELVEKICECEICHNLSDTPKCEICLNKTKRKNILCVVEDMRDIIALEKTNQYNGQYHVLGGKISPLDGIGPDDLNLRSLFRRINSDSWVEIIFAISPTIDGDTTMFYIFKKIKELNLEIPKVSNIARGIAFGDDLEYTDEITLGKSILNRVPYEGDL